MPLEAETCEIVSLNTWDREELAPGDPDLPTGIIPPTVSPAPPQDFDCEDFGTCPVYFQLCNEVNVVRFGGDGIFGTPMFEDDAIVEGKRSLLVNVEGLEFDSGWARVNMESGFEFDKDTGVETKIPRRDENDLAGLPVVGFAAYEFENGYLDGGSVKANYGGLFGHKTSVLQSALTSTP